MKVMSQSVVCLSLLFFFSSLFSVVQTCDQRFYGPETAPRTFSELTDFTKSFFDPDPTGLVDDWTPLTSDPSLTDFPPIGWKPLEQELFIEKMNESRTVLGLSNNVYFDQFIAKLRAGKCVNILMLGGSLTGGSCLFWEKGERAFATLLEHMINQIFPCGRGVLPEEDEAALDAAPRDYQAELFRLDTARNRAIRYRAELRTGRLAAVHRVVYRAEGATGSSYAASEFERLVCESINGGGIDLVLMEFAGNDLQDNVVLNSPGATTRADSSPRYLEFLIRKLEALHVSYMFLQGSFRLPHNPEKGVHGNAESIHLPVQQYYDAPTVSFPKLILKEFNAYQNISISKFFIPRLFRDEHSHQTGMGHLLITFMLLWNIQNDVYSNWHSHQKLPQQQANSEKPFKFLDEASWTILNVRNLQSYKFEKTSSLSIPGEYECSETDWIISDEARGKYGLISSKPGASCIFYFDLQNYKDPPVFVEIGFLKSYQSMGKFQVIFLSAQEPDDVEVLESETISASSETLSQVSRSYIIDGSWSDHSSQYYSQTMLVPRVSNRFIIEVLPNKHDPESTKVKLMSVSFRVPENKTCGLDSAVVDTHQATMFPIANNHQDATSPVLQKEDEAKRFVLVQNGELLGEEVSGVRISASQGLIAMTFTTMAVAAFLAQKRPFPRPAVIRNSV